MVKSRECEEHREEPGSGESQSGVGHCSRRVNVRVKKNTDGQMANGQEDQRQLEEAARAQHWTWLDRVMKAATQQQSQWLPHCRSECCED